MSINLLLNLVLQKIDLVKWKTYGKNPIWNIAIPALIPRIINITPFNIRYFGLSKWGNNDIRNTSIPNTDINDK